eukprot:CAMPEP_0184380684 /NCGR_PEP_ID=MMETSP0007-20130409/4960_1 /TAXON_ID=97485 /ORGANISM="Prymnesium parvum, Strain Texoma1" /LENGTH=57 /DNA_ID=CAMNT_0026726019 /DNA_START=591 /DNA_END=764 /DNA_ORIENTATION=+
MTSSNGGLCTTVQANFLQPAAPGLWEHLSGHAPRSAATCVMSSRGRPMRFPCIMEFE